MPQYNPGPKGARVRSNTVLGGEPGYYPEFASATLSFKEFEAVQQKIKQGIEKPIPYQYSHGGEIKQGYILPQTIKEEKGVVLLRENGKFDAGAMNMVYYSPFVSFEALNNGRDGNLNFPLYVNRFVSPMLGGADAERIEAQTRKARGLTAANPQQAHFVISLDKVTIEDFDYFGVGIDSRNVAVETLSLADGNVYGKERHGGVVRENFSLDELKSLLLQGFKNLESLHKRGMVHRDVKLQNFLYRRDNDCIAAWLVDYDTCSDVIDGVWDNAVDLEPAGLLIYEEGADPRVSDSRLDETARYASSSDVHSFCDSFLKFVIEDKEACPEELAHDSTKKKHLSNLLECGLVYQLEDEFEWRPGVPARLLYPAMASYTYKENEKLHESGAFDGAVFDCDVDTARALERIFTHKNRAGVKRWIALYNALDRLYFEHSSVEACKGHGISTEALRFLIDSSEVIFSTGPTIVSDWLDIASNRHSFVAESVFDQIKLDIEMQAATRKHEDVMVTFSQCRAGQIDPQRCADAAEFYSSMESVHSFNELSKKGEGFHLFLSHLYTIKNAVGNDELTRLLNAFGGLSVIFYSLKDFIKDFASEIERKPDDFNPANAAEQLTQVGRATRKVLQDIEALERYKTTRRQNARGIVVREATTELQSKLRRVAGIQSIGWCGERSHGSDNESRGQSKSSEKVRQSTVAFSTQSNDELVDAINGINHRSAGKAVEFLLYLPPVGFALWLLAYPAVCLYNYAREKKIKSPDELKATSFKSGMGYVTAELFSDLDQVEKSSLDSEGPTA